MLRCITVNAVKWAKLVNCCQQMMSSAVNEIRHQSPSSGDLSEVGEYSEEELKLLTEKWSRCCTFLFYFLLSCSILTTILYVLYLVIQKQCCGWRIMGISDDTCHNYWFFWQCLTTSHRLSCLLDSIFFILQLNQ